jgi:hypothetical protein
MVGNTDGQRWGKGRKFESAARCTRMRRTLFKPAILLLAACSCALVGASARLFRVQAQGDRDYQAWSDQEIAVNLSQGRAVLCATKEGIILGTIPGRGEPGSVLPLIQPVAGSHMGVLFGAAEWIQPESKDKAVRLDQEYPGLMASALSGGPQQMDSGAASDLEAEGVALLERLRQLAGSFHHKINLAGDEPLVRVVLAGYEPDYGPEAWVLDYHIAQDALGNDLWRTRVLRPSYTQLYPPEKGKPRTIMEVRYPPEDRSNADPEMLDLLQQNDSRLAPIRSASPTVSKAVELAVEGQSQKSEPQTLGKFFELALPAVAPPQSQLGLAMIDFENGFQWLIQPAELRAKSQKSGPRWPGSEGQPSPSDRPTLRNKPAN